MRRGKRNGDGRENKSKTREGKEDDERSENKRQI